MFEALKVIDVPSPTCAGMIGKYWLDAIPPETITVRMFDIKDAGTDSNGYLHLFGTDGKEQFIDLGGPNDVPDDGDDLLERGGTDTWSMRIGGVGTVNRVCVHIDDKGNDAAVMSVAVRGKTYYFDSNGSASGGTPLWLDADDDDTYPLWACQTTNAWPAGVWKPVNPD